MQAITTKHLPATNTKGARIKATAPGGSVIVSWDYDLDIEENHKQAALALIKKFNWYGSFSIGQMAAGGFAIVPNSQGDFEVPLSLADKIERVALGKVYDEQALKLALESPALTAEHKISIKSYLSGLASHCDRMNLQDAAIAIRDHEIKQ